MWKAYKDSKQALHDVRYKQQDALHLNAAVVLCLSYMYAVPAASSWVERCMAISWPEQHCIVMSACCSLHNLVLYTAFNFVIFQLCCQWQMCWTSCKPEHSLEAIQLHDVLDCAAGLSAHKANVHKLQQSALSPASANASHTLQKPLTCSTNSTCHICDASAVNFFNRWGFLHACYGWCPSQLQWK